MKFNIQVLQRAAVQTAVVCFGAALVKGVFEGSGSIAIIGLVIVAGGTLLCLGSVVLRSKK